MIEASRRQQPWWRRWSGSTVALCVFLLAAGFYLALEHQAHLLGSIFLWLPLLICIGMHAFMHGGHGHGGGSQHRRGRGE